MFFFFFVPFSSVNGEKGTLPPGKATLYAWEDPTSERALDWQCGTSTGTVTQIQVRTIFHLLDT